MASVEDRIREPEMEVRDGFALEVGRRAVRRRSETLRQLSIVGALGLAAICSAETPVDARGRGATLPGTGSPGDVYTNGPNSVTIDVAGLQVANVSVPAGSYVVHVSMSAANNSFGLPGLLGCRLTQGQITFWTFLTPAGGAIAPVATLSFTDVVSLSSAGTIAVDCVNNVIEPNTVGATARMTAILVGTLHQQ